MKPNEIDAIESALTNMTEKQIQAREAQYDLEYAKDKLSEAVLEAGLVSCLTVNQSKLRRLLKHQVE